MNSPTTGSGTPPPPEEGILRWLEARGHLLEMEVARELSRAGWSVSQSEPYQDPQTGKARETDINARLQKQLGEQVVCLELVIECKSSKTRPWLLLSSSPTAKGSSWVTHSALSQLGQEFLGALTFLREEQLKQDADKVFADLPMFGWPARPAFRFIEGLFEAPTSNVEKDQRDGGFTAVMQLASALGQFDKQGASRPPWVVRSICEFLVPVIVVNDNLFECWMDENGEARVERTHRGLLIASRDLDSPLSNYIVVVDVQGFAAFRKDAERSFERMLQLAPEVMPAALNLLEEDLAEHLAEQGRAMNLLRGLPGDDAPPSPKPDD
jgi:hypothetical protein